MDIAHQGNRLYVACDGGALVEPETMTGEVRGEWQLAGVPDETFFNPASGLIHVAIGKPELVESINPRTGECTQFTTGAGAKTTALVAPDILYVFSPYRHGILALREA